MNTPTHLLISAAVLTKPGRDRDNAAILVGALLPDLFIYLLFLWSKLAGIPELLLWREIYFGDGVQLVSAVSNSAPLYVLLLGIGWQLGRRWLALLATSALIHLAFDLPFHRSDAHRHFWPFSDWRFESPLSYWEAAGHSGTIAVVEAGLALVLAVLLWRRFGQRWVRLGLILAGASYVAVPLYFSVVF